ncbi:MAG: methyltransferase domain-containing protein [Nanoarchaeota archaeon]|nr:methyltransferase domain-containing protein [Nanoarchaeota archaeon]
MLNVLIPGRHHLLSEFLHDYIKNLVKKGIEGKKVERIIFAITSSDHENTRRNPVPLYLRALAIEKFSKNINCETKIYPISDVKETKKFAEYIIHRIEYLGGEKLTPKNTLIASSTPSVIKMFKKMGFQVITNELIPGEKEEKYSTLRPYEILNLLVKAGKKWRTDKNWKKYTSKSTEEIYLEYNLGDSIIEVFKDSLINEDANLTETRDYNSYARGMDQNIQFKFNDIAPFVVPGKIVDAGCGTGALIWHLSKNFEESDIIGIEATRKFYEYCKLQEYPNPFVYFYRKNILDQNFKENTVNTFIYSSVLHEIYSYISEDSLKKVIKNTFKELLPGGRIVIRDVVGPENPKEKVFLELNEKDGKDSGDVHILSTKAKFYKFVKDFKRRKIEFEEVKFLGKTFIELSIQDAYEFISKMNYTDNWKSEMNEEFGFWSLSKWKDEIKKVGFEIVPGSKSFKSEYIIEKMYKGKAKIYKKEKGELLVLDYPDTNIILAGEKPKFN